jgi:phage terminase large subunit GpA-like protein
VISDLLDAWGISWRPIERMSPSEWARRYRVLQEGTTARPGPFSYEGFEFFISIEDCAKEAVETGRKFCLMKPAQIGGTESMLNVLGWLMTYYPGPALYMTSKDELAKEFARVRITPMCATAEPLARKFLPGSSLLTTMRFVDGKLSSTGGKSVLNFQSEPRRIVLVDEADSLAEDLGDEGDPIKLAEMRLAAFKLFCATFLGAFAHPTIQERGTGRIYWKESDQRRGFVVCPHCSKEFWLQWEHVKVIPREGQSHSAAERDPSCYSYFAPCCGAELSDVERLAVARKAVQKSTLPPEVAKTKAWIGCHVSHLYTKPLLEFVRDWAIPALDSANARKVFVNKVLGECYEEAETQATVEVWKRLIIPDGENGAYKVGIVPPEVKWLTAGQDSNKRELHWAVWGWGHVQSEGGHPVLCGWLIDYGVEPGPAAEDDTRNTMHGEDLEVFDQTLYGKLWSTAAKDRQLFVAQCFHDSGWQHIAVYDYCRSQPTRSIPSKGLATDDRSKAPPVKWTHAPKWKVGDEEVSDPNLSRADLNTYLLKLDVAGLAGKKFVDKDKVPRARLVLPHDVTIEFLEHLASERLVSEDGRRRWTKTSHANHWWDCTIMAYAAALNLAPLSPSSAKVQAPSVVVREERTKTWGRGRSKWLRKKR